MDRGFLVVRWDLVVLASNARTHCLLSQRAEHRGMHASRCNRACDPVAIFCSASIRKVRMNRRDELPFELRDAYDEGYYLAGSGAWLDDPIVPLTSENVQKRLAKQMGFIDGLKEIWPKK